jgi:hypothetical protein
MSSFKKTYTNFIEKYISKVLNKVPGQRIFGNYRFLPIFFVVGGGIEFLMINWKVGPNQVNFCKRKSCMNLI